MDPNDPELEDHGGAAFFSIIFSDGTNLNISADSIHGGLGYNYGSIPCVLIRFTILKK